MEYVAEHPTKDDIPQEGWVRAEESLRRRTPYNGTMSEKDWLTHLRALAVTIGICPNFRSPTDDEIAFVDAWSERRANCAREVHAHSLSDTVGPR